MILLEGRAGEALGTSERKTRVLVAEGIGLRNTSKLLLLMFSYDCLNFRTKCWLHSLCFETKPIHSVSHNSTSSSFPQPHILQVLKIQIHAVVPQLNFLQFLTAPIPPISNNSIFPSSPTTQLSPVSNSSKSSNFKQLHFLQ